MVDWKLVSYHVLWFQTNKVEKSLQGKTKPVFGGEGTFIEFYGEGYLFDGGIIKKPTVIGWRVLSWFLKEI